MLNLYYSTLSYPIALDKEVYNHFFVNNIIVKMAGFEIVVFDPVSKNTVPLAQYIFTRAWTNIVKMKTLMLKTIPLNDEINRYANNFYDYRLSNCDGTRYMISGHITKKDKNTDYDTITIYHDSNYNELKAAAAYCVFDNVVIKKIKQENIVFGVIYKNYEQVGLTIISRNNKKTSAIKDRSVSKLVTGISYKRKCKTGRWYDFRKSNYDISKNTPEVIKPVPSVSDHDFSKLNEDEIEFFIHYLNMVKIKNLVEKSDKLKNIKNKLQNF